MKKSQLRETIKKIVKSKLNEINGIGAVSNKEGSLEATLYDNELIKLTIYIPGYGMNSRKFIASPAAVNINDFTFEYIKDQLEKVKISGFKDEEIQDLIDRVNTTLRPKITEGEETSNYVKAMDIWKRVKQHPTMGDDEKETYKQKLLQAAKKVGIELDLNEGPDGLWKNIRDKRERGEKPARKGSEAYKTAVEAGKRINSKN